MGKLKWSQSRGRRRRALFPAQPPKRRVQSSQQRFLSLCQRFLCLTYLGSTVCPAELQEVIVPYAFLIPAQIGDLDVQQIAGGSSLGAWSRQAPDTPLFLALPEPPQRRQEAR